MTVIDQSVVRILPDFKGFKTALRTGLKQATAGATGTVKVKLVADTTGLAASIRAAVATKNLPSVKVRVEADKASLRSFAAAVSAAGRGVRGTAGTTGLLPSVRDVEREGQQVIAAQRRTNRNAAQELVRAARTRRQLWEELGPPTLINWGGAGIKPMNLLWATVAAGIPVLTALASSALEAGTSIVALGSAAYGGALAVTGLVAAFSGVLGALKLHSSLQKAMQGQSTKVVQVADKAGQAQKRQKKSLTELAQAYKDAAQKVKDLRLQLEDLRVQQSGNALDTEEAVRRRNEVNSNFFATDLQKRQAGQAVLEARQRGKDIAAEIDKTNRDLAKRRRLAGSPEVKQAKDAVSAAKAARAAQASAPAAAGQLDAALKDLSPAARDLYNWIVANTEQFKRYRRSMEQAILPGFLTFLKQITARTHGANSTLDTFIDGVDGVGREISHTVADLGRIANTKWFRGQLSRLNKDNAQAFKLVGKAVTTMVRPIMQLVTAASPLIVRFAGYLQRVAVAFSDWVNAKQETGELSAWFSRAGDELAKWWGIAGNIASVLLSIFRASLPSGNDLATRLQVFTASIAAWAKSDAGQAKIKSFFDFFRNLDYGRLAKFAGSLAVIYGLLKAGSFTARHPIFTLLSVLAAKYPDETIAFVNNLAGAVGKLLGWVNDNQGAVQSLLLIAGAYKAIASLGKIKELPGFAKIIENSPLAKLFGDRGATPANPMYVLNVNEGGLGSLAGDAGKLSFAAMGAIAAAAAGTAWASHTAFDYGKQGKDAFEPVHGFIKDPNLKDWVASALLTVPGGLAVSQLANWAGSNVDKNKPKGDVRNRSTAIKTENDALKAFTRTAGLAAKMQQFQNEQTANAFKPLQDYITARKNAAKAEFNYQLATKGPIEAMRSLDTENNRSIHTLSGLLQQYGWNKDAADQYAKKVISIPPTAETKVTTPGLPGARTGFAELKTNIDKSTGQKVISLVMADGSTTVFSSLREAMTYQRALQSGLSLSSAAQAIKRDEEATRNRLYGHAATGGQITGRGTGTSDSIPTLLSNGEHVWTADEVRKAGGHDAIYRMRDAVKRGEVGFKAGGAVSWPFPVDVSKTMIPAAPTVGGVVSGDLNVAAIAEATARSMKASEKQLIALFEAGLVESGLRNLSYGDRDSVGFLQQRAGWGSVKQRMNVAYATRKFIDKAKRVDATGYTAGQLAQAVQVSAFPDRYDQRYADALAVLNMAPPFVAGGGPGIGGGGGGRGWAWQESVLRAAFGKAVNFFSTTGGKHAKNSWHYKGRAVDLTPSMGIFNWIRSHYGADTQELIYGPAKIGIRHGQPYNYGKGLNSQHMNHIHWAYANGGPVQKFDTGGVLKPGATMAVNNTRKPETVRTYEQEQALQQRFTRIDRRDLALLAAYIANAIAGQTISMDGRKVAETVRGYDYLPKGI